MIRTALCARWLTVVLAMSSCSSTTGDGDGSVPGDASAPGDAAKNADAANTDAAKSTDAATMNSDGSAPPDAAGDGGASQLVWFPGNYGLVMTGNNAFRDSFLTGALAGPFAGVEMVYPWTTCEPTMDDYQPCFDAIDADIAALAKGQHLLLLLQYKSFGGPDAVPKYLTGPGNWCVTVGANQVCGQYATANATIAMIWNPAVAARLQAWFKALAAHYGPGTANADKIAGIALPETATGEDKNITLADVGYTAAGYISAIEGNLTYLSKKFPTLPVFQYINYMPHGMPNESAALKTLGDFALNNPNIGLGCPDVGGGTAFSPPGYDTLINPMYQLHLPFNVAIEPMDYDAAITKGLPNTYAEATGPAAQGGMAAQFVVWQHVEGNNHVFTIDDVAKFLPNNPDPNTALPTY